MKHQQRSPLCWATGAALAILLAGTAVAATPQTFTEWAAQLPGGSNGPNDDADGDGILNLVEYAYGMNPLQAGREGLPRVTSADGMITYSFIRPKSVVGITDIVRVTDVVTTFSSVLTLNKVSETTTNETWAGSITGTNPSGFAWSSAVQLTAPALTGHAGSSRPGTNDAILPYDVQAAFNNDTFFWRIRYSGNEGKRHDYYRYTSGAWRKEGGNRRDSQSTSDVNYAQGATNINSTVYEQRTSIMISDPTAVSRVVNFDKFGCFLTCHNGSRHMPEWTAAAGDDGKYVNLAQVADGGVNSTKVLDLWHWRGARSNPVGKADDQYIQAMNFTNSTTGDNGGRKNDAGTAMFNNNTLVSGHPSFVFNPAMSGGKFAFNWQDFWATPLYFMVQTNAANLGSNAPNPVVMSWAEAVAAGYTPTEGDTVPARIQEAGAGSRVDITAFGTQFVRATPDTVFGQGILGTWDVQMQRLLNTGSTDDVQLVPGNTYHAGFEAHLWEYDSRNHYVSFPQSITLGPGGNIAAVDLRGAGADGRGTLPNWGDTNQFPVTRLYLFQPGITTWEFLSGANEAAGKVYRDPVTALNVTQVHPGASDVQAGEACASCHTVRASDPEPPGAPLSGGGSMELRTGQRGGVWALTPILQ
ncbi:MAG: ethylbenzene dehydrogenase-related protein [Limisphaerales bacterium]